MKQRIAAFETDDEGHWRAVLECGHPQHVRHDPPLTTWIPLLLILGVWRHIRKHFPVAYDPLYWGMVFPLGMYTVCTLQLSKAIRFEPLVIIPRYFVFVAIAAWLAVFIGLIHSLLTRKTSAAPTERHA